MSEPETIERSVLFSAADGVGVSTLNRPQARNAIDPRFRLGLVYVADIVLAADSTRFAAGFAGLGLPVDSGGTWFLPRLVGTRRDAAHGIASFMARTTPGFEGC